MIKIATIVGARPQFIKAAMLSQALKKLPEQQIVERLIHTGQHYDTNMSDVFFKEMDIPIPSYHLTIGSGSHGAMTGRMLEAIESVLIIEKPDWVIVYGDTNSTLAGALAAAKLHIPVAHIEAGLRSFNKKMPEEINRILTDHMADLLFTPTQSAADQLLKEGIGADKICHVGDIMCDAALHYQQKAQKQSRILSDLQLESKTYVLATIHRAENTDDPKLLAHLIDELSELATEVPVIWPLHPRTKKSLQMFHLLNKAEKALFLIQPVGYLDMLQLESHAKLILTDSGGVQKEAYFFQVPCITLRAETEWTELVKHGFNQLIPIGKKNLLAAFQTSQSSTLNWNTNLYGTGHTAQNIVNKLYQR